MECLNKLWIEKIKNELHIGISNIDIIDGISHIFEYNTPYLNIPSMYDNIEKYISVYNPKETIIIHNLSDKEIDNMIQFIYEHIFVDYKKGRFER